MLARESWPTQSIVISRNLRSYLRVYSRLRRIRGAVCLKSGITLRFSLWVSGIILRLSLYVSTIWWYIQSHFETFESRKLDSREQKVIATLLQFLIGFEIVLRVSALKAISDLSYGDHTRLRTISRRNVIESRK